ncbi:MAG: glycerol kinase [Candidatus Handelsmanbacteria bacterium RIFCSPLOWO2_12_FULL_64_10]|uniref:Glycerol kinase n=1 Tax=Handelsmanbacteria sp. (strain RIFCSPLOWO2_12_FULL_64_10) TaxID=1817868 RepID=A0A1F6CA02_HANXR|nr:MAG: glycerol kinase [Candidatus Handelsmanbacteria bacterium RIFCSPLOWO2_12_FULL_64_10]
MILAIDQGTTGTTALVLDPRGGAQGRGYAEVPQIYPQPGWVEHDPEAIWEGVCRAIADALRAARIDGSRVAGIGITNQRETTVLWDRRTGAPVHNAVVWQCRRTAERCDRLRPLAGLIRERTGLVLDPYFSATKIAHLLDSIPGLRARAERGEIAFGTVDAWLIHKFTAGRVHATDPTNASRTMLYHIGDLAWDDRLLAALDVPRQVLPEVRPSSGAFGKTASGPLPAGIPIAGVAGDQQAALFGQGAASEGGVKNTYGTGCFTLFCTGERLVPSRHGLLTTVCCGPSGGPAYALEGSVFNAGSAVQWLRDGLGLIASADETEALARSVPDAGGAFLVPAFTGLGAPHWDARARGTLVGLTRGSTKAHIVRATLESIACQTADLIAAMQADAGAKVPALKVDGGAARNDFLMQTQADLLGVPVIRPKMIETTALGAGLLAGMAVGLWGGPDDLAGLNPPERTFEPVGDRDRCEALLAGWRKAVETARYHGRPDP